MDRKDPYDIARAIVALHPWKTAARHNWALVPQTSAEAFLVSFTCEEERQTPVAGRLMLFEGVTTFRDFLITRQVKDFGVEMGPIDFRHYEIVGIKDGKAEIFLYEPGYVPRAPSTQERVLLASLLAECYGVLLRMEEKPDLPLLYADQKAFFARKEVAEGVWVDGPLRLPADEVVQQLENIALVKADCAKAKELPVFPKEIWEVDFVLVPTYHTSERHPRFLYLFSAVNAESGERMCWERLSVDGKPEGLKRLWEGHAQRLLTALLRLGRVPGELHVRSGRMMRFLRPLGLQLPFKLVQHAKLPSLDSVVNLAVQTQKV